MSSALLDDALAISDQWRRDLDMGSLVAGHLADLAAHGGVDVVALGKAAATMARAARAALGPALTRCWAVGPEGSAHEPWLRVGDHPVPGARSLAAGEGLLAFLRAPTSATTTLFLVSGGASSLCVAPSPPATISDLAAVWDAALAAGLDITALNQVRAATSLIAGGGVLREVRTPRSRALVLVDNVVSGAPWVASGLTYDASFTPAAARALLDRLGPLEPALRSRLEEAHARREAALARPVTTSHENRVIAEPGLLVEFALREARRRGYRVLEMGRGEWGDVAEVAGRWGDAVRAAATGADPICLVGAGEVTVRVSGTGRGGRCQEFAWRLAPALAALGRRAVVVARASDGCDFLNDVAGAWVDESTTARAAAAQVDWAAVLGAHDTYAGHRALGQLIAGGPTGWNLCDLVVCVVEGP